MFGINPSSDYRLTKGANHGLGSVYIYVSYSGPEKTEYDYPGSNKFSDEGGSASKGNLIYYFYQDSEAEAKGGLVLQKHSRRFDTGRFVANKPVDRSVRLLCFGCAGQRSKGVQRRRKVSSLSWWKAR